MEVLTQRGQARPPRFRKPRRSGGNVIDHDLDRLILYRRVRQKMGDLPLLITPANAKHPREIRLLTPRFERLS